MKTIYLILFAWNLIVLLTYGADKFFAVKKMRRISEKMLLTQAFLMGGVGAMFGMVMFNHKTAKLKFRISVPFFVVLNLILFILSENTL